MQDVEFNVHDPLFFYVVGLFGEAKAGECRLLIFFLFVSNWLNKSA